MWVVLHHTVFGRHLYAVGKNEEAARFSGIRTGRVIVAAYAICGVLTAVSSIFLAMYTRSILPSSHGNFYELYAIAAAVLGGFSLRGGEGSIIGVVLGAILLQVLQNLVNLLGIPSSLNFAVSGSVILIGVLADQEYADFRERRERLRRLAAGAISTVQTDDPQTRNEMLAAGARLHRTGFIGHTSRNIWRARSPTSTPNNLRGGLDGPNAAMIIAKSAAQRLAKAK